MDTGSEPVARRDYKSELDPLLVRSKLTGRGPLTPGWQKRERPLMCAYKVVRAQAEYWGVQNSAERLLINSLRQAEYWGVQNSAERLLINSLRQIFLRAHKNCFGLVDYWFAPALSHTLSLPHTLASSPCLPTRSLFPTLLLPLLTLSAPLSSSPCLPLSLPHPVCPSLFIIAITDKNKPQVPVPKPLPPPEPAAEPVPEPASEPEGRSKRDGLIAGGVEEGREGRRDGMLTRGSESEGGEGEGEGEETEEESEEEDEEWDDEVEFYEAQMQWAAEEELFGEKMLSDLGHPLSLCLEQPPPLCPLCCARTHHQGGQLEGRERSAEAGRAVQECAPAVFCVSCGEFFCHRCFHEFHITPRLQQHATHPIASSQTIPPAAPADAQNGYSLHSIRTCHVAAQTLSPRPLPPPVTALHPAAPAQPQGKGGGEGGEGGHDASGSRGESGGEEDERERREGGEGEERGGEEEQGVEGEGQPTGERWGRRGSWRMGRGGEGGRGFVGGGGKGSRPSVSARHSDSALAHIDPPTPLSTSHPPLPSSNISSQQPQRQQQQQQPGTHLNAHRAFSWMGPRVFSRSASSPTLSHTHSHTTAAPHSSAASLTSTLSAAATNSPGPLLPVFLAALQAQQRLLLALLLICLKMMLCAGDSAPGVADVTSCWQDMQPQQLGHSERLAFWINVYNALAMHGVSGVMASHAAIQASHVHAQGLTPLSPPLTPPLSLPPPLSSPFSSPHSPPLIPLHSPPLTSLPFFPAVTQPPRLRSHHCPCPPCPLPSSPSLQNPTQKCSHTHESIHYHPAFPPFPGGSAASAALQAGGRAWRYSLALHPRHTSFPSPPSTLSTFSSQAGLLASAALQAGGTCVALQPGSAPIVTPPSLSPPSTLSTFSSQAGLLPVQRYRRGDVRYSLALDRPEPLVTLLSAVAAPSAPPVSLASLWPPHSHPPSPFPPSSPLFTCAVSALAFTHSHITCHCAITPSP
ncbi:unnamed protein product [Closterium sp. NIES-65]|nr:unnamed protein product [Closterium sp. NIES-65]